MSRPAVLNINSVPHVRAVHPNGRATYCPVYAAPKHPGRYGKRQARSYTVQTRFPARRAG